MSITPQTLHPFIHNALRSWKKTRQVTPASALSQLQLVQQELKTWSEKDHPANRRLAANRVLLEGMKELKAREIENESEYILRRRFLDGQIAQQVANELGTNVHDFNRRQRQSIKRLAEIIAQRENDLRQTLIRQAEEHLPLAKYDHFIGLKDERRKLLDQLLVDEPPWLHVVAGLGGIGKSALADKTARAAIRAFRFRQVIWTRIDETASSLQQLFDRVVAGIADQLPEIELGASNQQRLVQVRQMLKANAYLVIIDNVESESVLAYLLDQLTTFTEPSRFLITSRARLAVRYQVHVVSLDEMPAITARQLVRCEAQARNLKGLMTATAEELAPLLVLTGGNPLALKLAVSLASLMPLSAILAGFRSSNDHTSEEIYDHIFRKVWQTLSHNAQTLLTYMPMVGAPGARYEQLQAGVHLSDNDIWPAISELSSCSLLEARGTALARRFGIHRLTESFVRGQITDHPAARQRGKAAKEIDPRFHRFVGNTIRFWQDESATLTEMTYAKITNERENIIRTAQHGLTLESLAEETGDMLLQMWPLVKHGGHWAAWATLFEVALGAVKRPALRARLGNKLGFCLRLQGFPTQAIEVHRQALNIAKTAADLPEAARITANLSVDYVEARDYENAEKYGNLVLEKAAQLPAKMPAEKAVVFNTLGLIALQRGAYKTARDRFIEASLLLEKGGRATYFVQVQMNLAVAYQKMKAFAAALACYDRVEAVLQQTKNKREMVKLAINRGTTYSRMDRWREAEAAYRAADIGYVHRIGDLRLEAMLTTNIGYALLRQEQPVIARDYLAEAVGIWRLQEDEVMLANALGSLAETQLMMLGKRLLSRENYLAALTLLKKHPDDAWANSLTKHFEAGLRKINDEE